MKYALPGLNKEGTDYQTSEQVARTAQNYTVIFYGHHSLKRVFLDRITPWHSRDRISRHLSSILHAYHGRRSLDFPVLELVRMLQVNLKLFAFFTEQWVQWRY